MLLPNKSRKSVFEKNAFEWHEAFCQTNSRQFFNSAVSCQFSIRFRKDFVRPQSGIDSVPDFFFELLRVTFSICKVGDCGLQTYQTVTILKRATTLEFTTNSPILYIHCYAVGFYLFVIFSNSSISFSHSLWSETYRSLLNCPLK